jgi:hypothetical protein
VSSAVLVRMGHAFGGPTYLVVRPDGLLVARLAFDEVERDADAMESDEIIGNFCSDGKLKLLASGPAARLAWGAIRPDGQRMFRYTGERNCIDGRAVWRLRE